MMPRLMGRQQETHPQISLSPLRGPFIQAFRTAREDNLTLASNAQADWALMHGLSANETFWTGTMIVHEKRGVAFSEVVRSGRFLFEVPRRYRGWRNTALVMQDPHYDIDDDMLQTSLLITPTGRFSNVRNLAFDDGFYNVGTAGIPRGHMLGALESDQVPEGARYLKSVLESREGAFIGAILRNASPEHRRKVMHSMPLSIHKFAFIDARAD